MDAPPRVLLSTPFKCHKCEGLRTGDGPHAPHYGELRCGCVVLVDCMGHAIGEHACPGDLGASDG